MEDKKVIAKKPLQVFLKEMQQCHLIMFYSLRITNAVSLIGINLEKKNKKNKKHPLQVMKG